MEKTHIEIDQKTANIYKEKDYTDWFPTLNLSFEFTEKENITLGYSRRLRRPRSWSLNPFRSLTSLTFYRQGNPDLDPSYPTSLIWDISNGGISLLLTGLFIIKRQLKL